MALKPHLISISKDEGDSGTHDAEHAEDFKPDETSSSEAGNPRMPRRKISKKALAVVIAASVVIASGTVVWALFLRPWSTEEVGDHVINDPTSFSPGFKHNLAGKTITVSGKITTVEQYNTTRGPINLLTLDDYAYIRLVIWGPTSYEVGNNVNMPVRFDWATCNDERHVYSPQIDFPWFYLLSVGVVVDAVSNVAGTVFAAEELDSGQLRLTVFDHYPEEKAALANCTLMKGERTWEAEYIDVLGVWNYGRTIDQMASLENAESDNGFVRYTDSNHDGNLSRGDWFDISGLERPSDAGGIRTYMLNVGYTNGAFSPGGVCYLVLTHDGLVRMEYGTPYIRIALNNRTDGSVEAKVVVLSRAVGWDNVTIQLTDGNQYVTWNPRSEQLTGPGPTIANLGDAALGSLSVHCTAEDQEGNGLLDEGDSIVFAADSGGFSEKTNYSGTLIWEPTHEMMGRSWTFHG